MTLLVTDDIAELLRAAKVMHAYEQSLELLERGPSKIALATRLVDRIFGEQIDLVKAEFRETKEGGPAFDELKRKAALLHKFIAELGWRPGSHGTVKRGPPGSKLN